MVEGEKEAVDASIVVVEVLFVMKRRNGPSIVPARQGYGIYITETQILNPHSLPTRRQGRLPAAPRSARP